MSGCLISVFLGVGGAYLVMGFTHTTVIVTGFSIALAFLVAAAIGIFFRILSGTQGFAHETHRRTQVPVDELAGPRHFRFVHTGRTVRMQ
ncbi:MAG: hypothetical protein KGJ08_02675 [Gammaproteobacteria bacterium]|nr:hypothetical protein [Gammaproteobacteria bacterium]